MTVFSLGINHRTASLEIRDKVAFLPQELAHALKDLQDTALLEEAAILSTCNRTEIYGFGDYQQVLPWLAESRHIPLEQIQNCHYLLQGQHSVQHMMKVACGLDSLVLGEPQILGQLKSAYSVAREAGTLQGQLNQVFQQSFAIAKRVRTETAIGHNPVSVAYAAVNLSQQIFADISDAKALLIGAGETIDLVAKHLKDKGVAKILVANRTLSRAQELAERYQAEAILLAEIPDRLHNADIVISSTASQLPILGKGAVESALKKRKHKPIFMVDIAVPRDIEPEVGNLEDVYLFTVDDLQQVVEENIRGRKQEASKAEVLIEQAVEAWLKQYRTLEVVDTIRAYRRSVEDIRDRELEKARRQLASGQPAEEVIQLMARSLTNKLMHQPTANLKQVAEQGRSEHVELVTELLGMGKIEKDQDKT